MNSTMTAPATVVPSPARNLLRFSFPAMSPSPLVSRMAGVHVHFQHVSTAISFEAIRRAKAEGLPITCETAPHYLALSDEALLKYGTLAKMNPPLRTKEDRQALLEGLKNDVFDVISTDHAPHTMVEKGVSMKSAPFGIVGLETSVSLTITELVDKGWITPMQMAEKMSYNPAQILHLTNKGSLKPGKDADVVVIDPKESYVIDVKDFVSKGKNTPFQGKKVNGKVKVTICGGRVVYEDK